MRLRWRCPELSKRSCSANSRKEDRGGGFREFRGRRRIRRVPPCASQFAGGAMTRLLLMYCASFPPLEGGKSGPKCLQDETFCPAPPTTLLFLSFHAYLPASRQGRVAKRQMYMTRPTIKYLGGRGKVCGPREKRESRLF